MARGPPGSAARELPHEQGAVRGREEAAAARREAAQLHGVVVARVVLRVPGGAGLQPQLPVCGEERLRRLGVSPVTPHTRSGLGLVPAPTAIPGH